MAKVSFTHKTIENARRNCQEHAREDAVSSVVWIGDNKYIVVKDGNEIRI